ncbi:MAG: hypothetical protein JW864_07830 [Spirochaetes bacterium]|nr:hypothetical protein [Spirochaetota bacterium]
MITNSLSRIILNIILPEFETFLNSCSGNYAVSSLFEHEQEFFNYRFLCGLNFSSEKYEFIIPLYYENIDGLNKNRINEYLNEHIYSIKLIINFLFKKNIKVYVINDEPVIKNDRLSRIDISFNAEKSDSYLSVLIPPEFFSLFSYKSEDGKPDIDSIEKSLNNFFRNPENLFPDIKSVFNSLNEKDIQRMFYHLRKNNLLTPYQISLMLMAVPQHTVLIKRNLSANTVKDVDTLIKKLDVNKRDLAGGVYSIEEALYMLMKKNEDFHYSKFCSDIKNRLRMFLNSRTLISVDFYTWISEMDSDDLYQVISISKDDDIINSISDNPDLYYDILSKSVSGKKIRELYSVLKKRKISFPARMESQANMISYYKKIRIKKLNPGYDNFFTLLSKIDRDDIIHLLFQVGWFVLSTALKKTDKQKAIYLTEKLPSGARYLIVDVLQGIINPNIIHDEIQINKARSACVRGMVSLYEDGIINLLQ